MLSSDLSTEASMSFTCKDECSNITDIGFTFNHLPSEIVITVSSRSSTSTTPKLWSKSLSQTDIDTLTTAGTTKKFDIPFDPVTASPVVTSPYIVNVFVTVTWVTSPLSNEVFLVDFNQITTGTTTTAVTTHQRFTTTAHIGESIYLDYVDTDTPVPSTIDQFSSSFITADMVPQATTQAAYMGTISFTNFYKNPITAITLTLTGPVRWNSDVNDACNVNGKWITPTYLNPPSEGSVLLSNNQTIILNLSEVLQTTTGQDKLVTILCGEAVHGMEIIVDNKLADFSSDPSITTFPSNYLSIIPTYKTVDDSVPSAVYRFSLSKTDLEASQSAARIVAIPKSSHIDFKYKLEGPAAIFASFEVLLPNLQAFSRPFEVSVEAFGLGPDAKQMDMPSDKRAKPRIIVAIEPDYTNEVDQFSSNQPVSPAGLKTTSYILPFSLDTSTTPTLVVREGFLATHFDLPFSSTQTRIPKRYINIIVPMDALDIVTFPIVFNLRLRWVKDAESTEVTPLTSLTMISEDQTAIQSKNAKQWEYYTSRVQKTKLQWDVNPNGVYQYPDHFSAYYAGLIYRFSFPTTTKTTSLGCTMYEQICTTKYTCTYGTGTGTSTSTGTGSTRRNCRYVTTCNMVQDNSAVFKSSFVSQDRVDFDIKLAKISEEFSPKSFRRIECSGTWIVEQQPAVKDFRSTSTATAKLESNSVDPVFAWTALKEGGVSPVIVHTLSREGNIVGYTEIYNVKNSGLSTLAIVMLCLIPLWIAIVVGIVVLIVVVAK
jgi:hypothetical protein